MNSMLRIGDVSINIKSTINDIVQQFMASGWIVIKDAKVNDCKSLCLEYSSSLYIVLDGDELGHIRILRIQSRNADILSECGDLYLCGIPKDKMSSSLGELSPDYDASWLGDDALRHQRYVWKADDMLHSVELVKNAVRSVAIVGKSYETTLPHVVMYNKRPICVGKSAPYKLPDNGSITLTLNASGVVTGIRCINFGKDRSYSVPELSDDFSMSKVLSNWYCANTPNGACVKLESDSYVVTLYFRNSKDIDSVDIKAVIK